MQAEKRQEQQEEENRQERAQLLRGHPSAHSSGSQHGTGKMPDWQEVGRQPAQVNRDHLNR
eukprot:scaffold123859_cov20-Tisochrysis_lutea.AAC.1